MSPLPDRAEADPGHGVDFMLGLFLVASPHLLNRAEGSALCWNAWTVGSLITAIELLDLVEPLAWKTWFNLLAGAWLAASPWMLGFADVAPALWLDLVSGLVLMGLSGFDLWSVGAPPDRRRLTPPAHRPETRRPGP